MLKSIVGLPLGRREKVTDWERTQGDHGTWMCLLRNSLNCTIMTYAFFFYIYTNENV